MRKLATFSLVAAFAAGAVLMTPAYRGNAGERVSARAQSQTVMPTCAPWKEAASRLIAQLAQADPVNFLRISESVTGMRHAHRLCELGFRLSACREYDAIIHDIPRRLHVGPTPPMCQSIAVDTPAT